MNTRLLRVAVLLAGGLLLFASRCGWGQTNASLPLRTPSAIAYDAQGNLYIADADRNQVLESTLAGTLVVVAGNGSQGFSGDGGPAAAAELNGPQGLAFGPDGTLYVADTGNARVRAVSAGVITTFAGTGRPGSAGDGGAATSAQFRQPSALAVDTAGALLVCDSADQRVRRIRNGMVEAFAGNGVQGFGGDGGPAMLAQLDKPSGVGVAADGRVFIADTHNQRVRAVGTDGVISTFAGSGQPGFAGDSGPASAAMLSAPRGLEVTSGGTLLIADEGNQRVRGVSPAGVIMTLAGNGTEGRSIDGVAGGVAAMHAPRAVAVSIFGAVTIADTLNGTVRELTPASTLFQPAGLVPQRVTTMSLSSASAADWAQSASVVVAGAAGVPQGTVQWSADGSVLGSATLNGGSASVSLGSLGAGPHTLTATYLGDGLNPAATASAAIGAPIAVTASANPASIEYGMPVPVLTGSLTGVLPADTGEVGAVFSTTAAALASVGSYPITATLTGAKSAAYTLTMAPDSGTLQVLQATSKTSLANTQTAYAGMPLQLTATVGSTTSGQPTGQVQFLDGATVVATAPVATGSATGLYLAPPVGNLSLTAQYVGDKNFQPSISAVQIATVTPMPDFGLAVAGSGTATVTAGGMATYNVSVSSQSGPFTGAVSLSAAGLPHGATVSFSPAQVIPGVNTATVTVTVQTSAAQAALAMRGGRSRTAQRGAVATLTALAGCVFLLRKRRRALLLLLSAGLLAGCGARSVEEGLPGVTVQSYALQVTGTGTNPAGTVVTHSVSLSLAVQQ